MASDAGEWLEQNWKMVVLVAAVVLTLVLGTFGVFQWNRARTAQAQEDLAEGMRLFALAENGEADGSYENALRLFGELSGRSDEIGHVAGYYRGLTLLRTGQASEAIAALETVRGSAEDGLLRQSAAVILADAFVRQGEPARAVEVLRGVAASGGAYPEDMALVQAGRILRNSGEVEQARSTWQDVVDRFPQSVGGQEARQLLDQLAADADQR